MYEILSAAAATSLTLPGIYINKRVLKSRKVSIAAAIIIFFTVFSVNLKLMYQTDIFFNSLLYCFFPAIYLLASINDIYEKQIPNNLCIACFVIGIVYSYFKQSFNNFMLTLLYLLAASAVLTLIYFLSRKNIGLGDLKLMISIPLFNGITGFFAIFFLSTLLCSLFSIILLLFKKITLKTALPFAPFLFAGVILYNFLVF